MKRMKPGKAPGPENVPFELLNSAGPAVKSRLMELLTQIWNSDSVPKDFKNANIITIFKKGDRMSCGNYHGISLLCIAGKIFARILLDRLLQLAEEILPESQCGFRPSRGTIDMIFCARQLQEKSREQQQPLMQIFRDLRKAFDKVPRPAMWLTLAKFGCPDRFINLIRALHDGTTVRVIQQGNVSEKFEINGGLKQGCVIAPTLVALYTAAMMDELPLDEPSVEIRYRLDGGLFKLSRLRSRTKTTFHNFCELQYADDNDTVTQKPKDLQPVTSTADQFNAAYKIFGMDVNTEKTKLLVQHASNQPQHIIPTVQVNTRTVESVPSFSYLGSLLSSVATCEDEIQNRIRAAHAAYGRLTERVFERRSQVDLKRQERKRRQAATPPPAILSCDYCPRLFRHTLGLLSHVRAHKRHQKDSRRKNGNQTRTTSGIRRRRIRLSNIIFIVHYRCHIRTFGIDLLLKKKGQSKIKKKNRHGYYISTEYFYSRLIWQSPINSLNNTELNDAAQVDTSLSLINGRYRQWKRLRNWRRFSED